MDASSLDMLEFPKIRELISRFTSFPASRELALELQPSTRPAQVELLLRQAADGMQILSLRPGFSIGSAHDVREQAQIAAKGLALEPAALLEICETIASCRVVYKTIQKLADQVPALWAIATGITPMPELEKEISRCITASGDISETASPLLTDIRQKLKASRQQLFERLENLLHSQKSQKYIQEQFVTEREGRYVIPVKAEYRREFKGLIHDMSNTGSTVFIEPWETVELGNDLRQLVLEEKQEMDRILAQLSSEVGAAADIICTGITLLAEIDLIIAKARYGEKMESVIPAINASSKTDEQGKEKAPRILYLSGARHPLLKGKAVPLTVEIGQDYYILIITGPNTGGKTVALKTIGLLAMMAQAGIPIPALEGSSLPVFDAIFADIGDQQSIEQTLSTFSWHIGNIVSIIKNSTEKSLVLLDELGISTDPGEGSALAKAILQHFLDKGTITVATTHYSDLKAFAHTTSGMRNASLDFNPATFVPTYHLTVGTPGRSNALSIAANLGLNAAIISAARRMMSPDSQKMDSLLNELMVEKQKYQSMLDQLTKDKADIDTRSRQLQEETVKLREQERKLFQEESDALLKDAAALERLIRETESDLRKNRKKEQVDQARKALNAVRQQMESQVWQAKISRLDKPEPQVEKIVAGDRVRLPDKDIEGTVISVDADNKQVEIQVGKTKLLTRLENIEKLSPSGGEVLARFPAVRKHILDKPVSMELDLRGKRADEVPIALDSYLNSAFLSSLGQVRIIHGYATGTVRQVVREILPTHPLVKSFRPGSKEDGGDGVTLVQL